VTVPVTVPARVFAAATSIRLGYEPSSQIVKVFRGVGGSMTMSRYTLRFWGILESVSALAALFQDASPADRTAWLIEVVQNASLLFYYGLEHYCFVEYCAPNTFPAAVVGSFERTSCAAWLVWIILEFLAQARQLLKLWHSDKLTFGEAVDVVAACRCPRHPDLCPLPSPLSPLPSPLCPLPYALCLCLCLAPAHGLACVLM
jgi:hypothetical protein